MNCKKCNTPMVPGLAIKQTLVGSLDMGEVCTLSPGGPGKLEQCSYKCPACGWSVW